MGGSVVMVRDMMWKVYLLADSSGAPRYVGVTRQPLRARLRQHIVSPGSGPVGRWVRGLVKGGDEPAMEVLQRLPGLRSREAAEIVERAWMETLVARGADLLNRAGREIARDLCVSEGGMPR